MAPLFGCNPFYTKYGLCMAPIAQCAVIERAHGVFSVVRG